MRPQVPAAQRTYYVAPNGNDAASGLSPERAFRHIQRCADVVASGDTCQVRAGTYRETVTVRTPDVTLRPYRTDWVIVSGLDPVGGPWLPVGGPGVYAAPFTSRLSGSALDNQLFVDSGMVSLARWPAPGSAVMRPREATAGPGTTSTLICDSGLADTAAGHFWRGALLHVLSGLGWWANTVRVTDSGVGGAACGRGVGWVTFPRVPLPYGSGIADRPYFDVVPQNTYDLSVATIKQALALMRAPGAAPAWFWDGTRLILHLAAGALPNRHLVEVKARTDAFVLEANHVTLTGPHTTSFEVFGAAVIAHGDDDRVDGLTGLYMNHFVDFGRHAGTDVHPEQGGVTLLGQRDRFTNSEISYTAGDAVAIAGDRAYVYDNLIKNVGYAGAGGAGVEGEFSAPGSGSATHATVDHNTLDNLGAAGIVLFALGHTVTYNNIARTGMIVNDVTGGLLSDGNFVGNPLGGPSTFAYNWVHDNQDTVARAHRFCFQPPNSCATAGSGIYLDLSAAPWLIHHNVVWNEPYADVALNGNGVISGSQDNLVYNNTLAATAATAVDLAYSDATMTGTVIQNNIFVPSPTLAVTYTVPPVLSPNLQGNAASMASGRPIFRDPARHDFHLAPGSAAIGSGVVIPGISTVRDQGAYASHGPDAAWGPPGCLNPGCTP